jgi:hypothetical protein
VAKAACLESAAASVLEMIFLGVAADAAGSQDFIQSLLRLPATPHKFFKVGYGDV